MKPTEHKIGGCWGNMIQFTRPEQWDQEISFDSTFDVHGWKSDKPKVGDILRIEGSVSWMFGQFTEVRPCADPPDMFFGKIRLVAQQPKTTGAPTYLNPALRSDPSLPILHQHFPNAIFAE